MTIAKRLEYPRILSASIATLLLAAGLPAQSRYFGELDGKHSVTRVYKKLGSCTIVKRVTPGRQTITYEPGIFDIFPPSNFSCQPHRFREGHAVVNHPDVPVVVELSDPTAAPTVVNLSEPPNVTARITLMGRAQFREGGDDHAVRIGVEAGLDPGARIARNQTTCSRQAAFVTDKKASRQITADALCSVSVMDVVEGSVVMADVDGVMTVTEFGAEVESEFYIVMDHGSPDDGSSLGKGARLTYTVKTRYKFQLAEDRLKITKFLPPNKDKNDNPIDLIAGDVTNFEATVRYSLRSQEMANIVLNIFNHKGEVLATGDPVLGKGEDSCLGSDSTPACPVKLTIENVTIPDEGPLFLGAEMIELTGVTIVQSPDIVYSVADLDFEVLHIEVTQAIQDNLNEVPLVADKRTFVRVYAKRSKVAGEDDLPPGEKPVFPRLEVQLTGNRGGGQPTPLNPSTAEALPAPPFVNIAIRQASPIASAIFELPPQWTTEGNLELTATVNPEGAVPEVNSENNSWDPPLTVKFARRNIFNIIFAYNLDHYCPAIAFGLDDNLFYFKDMNGF